MESMDMKDKVAIVTGGSRGIGFAIARELAGLGCRVALTARTAEAADKAARELGGGDRLLGLACDVSDRAQVDAAVETVLARWGRIDFLVNNAGITADGLLLRMSDEDWGKVLATNLTGAFHGIRAAARPMMKQRDGRILNISSVVGLTGNAGQANYAAAKAGLIGLTKSAAKELASRGIRVNALAPGFIETDMTRAIPEAAREELKGRIPLGRLGSCEDIARMAAFLLGPGGDYITGQTVVIDGGLAMI